jgi:hypothetical protein
MTFCALPRAGAAVIFYLHRDLRTGKVILTKNRNTTEKRRREIEKKQRADDKRKKRQRKTDVGERRPNISTTGTEFA